ncbi:enoyl-CoA hydratase/isomerase family protein [Bradyrhizobium sp. Pear76]|uniref:enoyl-CoA hydratase-related protein n=1 Tax=Bradyrhizobium oropedii TaxID=1571201 RepID=UPI00237BF19A|nr:enoyl-CoA hydratase-related protein [Bradyrhizobium oropedii]MCC8962442.1 enoyl-CoA hydratase/isomerase family protein [Bradyrhizobium oropedii]
MTDQRVVLSEKKGAVFYITLNRPEVLNAMNLETERALMESLRRFRDDDELLVAVLTGAGGRAFSAGMDLKEVARCNSEGQGPRQDEIRRFAELEIWKPIIAAVDGYCVAGGFEIALQCDIRIATSQSTFGLPEPRWNLMANYFGCHNLSRMIPLGEAMYIQLTGNRIGSQEALRCGLLHSVHPDRDALMKEADAIADSITLCSPLAIQAIKQLVMNGRSRPVEESYKMGEPMSRRLMDMEDGTEGPKSFAEKRRPVWKMR